MTRFSPLFIFGIVGKAGLLLGVLADPCSAQQSVPAAEIRCASLNSEETAELEARLVGEMLVQGLSDVRLELACDEGHVAGSLYLVQRRLEEEERLGSAPAFEQLYRLAVRLIDAARLSEASAAEKTAVPEVTAPASAVSATSVEATPAPTEQSRPPGAFHSSWALGVGPAAQVFGGKNGALLGPRLELEFRPLQHFALRASGAHYFQLGQASGFALRDTRFGVAPVWLNSWFRVGAEIALTIVDASSPSGYDDVGGSQVSIRPAVSAFLELAPTWGQIEPYVTGGISWVNAERVLAVEGEPQSTIPQVQGILGLGVRVRFSGN